MPKNDNDTGPQTNPSLSVDDETRRQLGSMIESGIGIISEAVSKFVEVNFGGPDQFVEALLKIQATAARFVQAIPAMQERLKAAEKSVFVGLLDYSWYFDPEMNAEEFFTLARLVEQKDESAINKMLVTHFRTSLDAIEQELNTRHNDRTRILAKAFKSHREGLYALAIPVFLAQADGISRDLIGAEYFLSKKSKKLVDSLLGEVTGESFFEAAFQALRPTGAIRVHTSEKKDGSFNRHAVMHGSDLDYDTELNSFKAVSLLNFMSRMIQSKHEELLSKAH